MKRLLSLLFVWAAIASPALAIERNVAGQTIELMVLENGLPKTGDAANLTAYVLIDGDATEDPLADTSATEVDSTNLPGLYRFDLSQAETNGAKITYGGKSSTADCYVVPVTVATVPAGFSTLTIASNAVDADVEKVEGSDATDQISAAATASLNSYDPPTRAELTSDKNEILATTSRYNAVRHVGSGQTYSTITAAQTAAAAGDLIVIHAGTYNEAGLGKQDVTYYFLPGAIINYTGAAEKTFKTSISNTRFRVLGHGRFINATGQCFYNETGGSANIYAECDSISGAAIYTDQSGASIIVKAKRAISGSPVIETSGFDNMCLVDCPDIHTTDKLATVGTADAHAVFQNARVICTGTTPIGGTDGTVILRNVYFSADAGASGNGLNSPGSVRLICESGGLYQAHSGRPSFSGVGTIEVSAGFVYDAAASTHSGTFIRNVQHPLASADSGATAVARTGADGDTLETLSDEIGGISAGTSPTILQSGTITVSGGQTAPVLSAGSADNDAYNNQLMIIVDQSTATQKDSIAITDYVGSSKTVTLARSPIFTIATGDSFYIIAAPPATVSGTVDANLVQIGGDTQSATDLKDFADAGYDPSTNNVNANTLAIEGGDASNTIRDAPWTATTRTLSGDYGDFETFLAAFLAGADDFDTAFQANATTFFGSTGQNMASLASASDLTTALNRIGTPATSLASVIDTNLDAQVSTRFPTASYTAPPSASDIAAAVGTRALATAPTAGTWDEAMAAARAQAGGKWDISGGKIRIYAHDGTTVLYTLNLDSGSAAAANGTSRTPE